MTGTVTVTLLEQENDTMVSDWTDRVTLSRNARGRFTVKMKKYCQGDDGRGARRWMTWAKEVGLSSPLQVLKALDDIENEGISLDWYEATALIAELDWITAAIIADRKKIRLPALPEASELAAQRSLRTLGGVDISVKWGYDLHKARLSTANWIDISNGYDYDMQSTYYYEGERFTAYWSFFTEKDRPYLEVTYGDDGGTGWRGELQSIDSIKGKSIDGFDVAKLILRAAMQDTDD